MIPMLRSALAGGDREPVPPARVRDAIDRQRHQSEKLIGWVQLAVVGTFAALYAASPKTFAADVMFEPVPWAPTSPSPSCAWRARGAVRCPNGWSRSRWWPTWRCCSA